MQRLVFVAVLALALFSEVESCTSLVECIYPLQGAGNSFGGETMETKFESGQLDAFCRSVVEARECFQQLNDVCDDEVASAHVEMELTRSEFVCSDEGRELIAALDGSPCIDNEELGTEAAVRVEVCALTLYGSVQAEIMEDLLGGMKLDTEGFCQFLKEYANCAVETVRGVCGDSFANLVQTMVEVEVQDELDGLGVDCNAVGDRSVRRVRNLFLDLKKKYIR